ncbi:hypothetical protein Tco_1216934 [Tanacetum coccineum]
MAWMERNADIKDGVSAIQIKKGIQAARDRQKSLADKNRKPMEFQVLSKVGTVAYRLELPDQLSHVNSTFHVSNLKKCYADEPLCGNRKGG